MASATVDFRRHSWIMQRVQGWRWEIGLAIALALVLQQLGRINSFAPLVVEIGLITLVAGVPAVRNFGRLHWQKNQIERRVGAVLWTCDVVGRNGMTPTVSSFESIPAGWRAILRLPAGLYFRELERRLPEIEAAMGLFALRIEPSRQGAAFVRMTAITANVLDEGFQTDLLSGDQQSIFDPIALGQGEDGLPVTIGLVEHNLLIGGEPGSGKSVALSSIIGAVALDPYAEITLLDGKQVELAAWKNCASAFVGPSQGEAVQALYQLQERMNERYETLARERKRKVDKNSLFGIHVLVIDELAFYLRGGDKALRERFAELLRDLVSRGRAAGIVVVAATQKPSHEVVPTWIRDLFSYRLAMRCTSNDSSDTILGQGWASQGYSASLIDPVDRGVGLLLAEGGRPLKILTPFLSDDEIDAIANQAERLRQGG